MKNYNQIRKYSTSLFKTILEKKINFDDVKNQLNFILNNLNDDLKIILEHPAIEIDKKEELIKNIFKNKIIEELMNFIVLLSVKKKLNLLKDIVNFFDQITSEFLNIEKIVVKSAFELDIKQKEKLEKMFENILNKKTNVDYIIDKKLICGIMINIRDKILENSIKTRLTQFKNNIIINWQL